MLQLNMKKITLKLKIIEDIQQNLLNLFIIF